MQRLLYCVHCGLSVERFQRYSKGDEGLVPPLARYLWNLRLSEALYPTLNCIEIGMRNSVHRSFSAEYGPLWFDTPGLLFEAEIKSVEAAKYALARTRKPLTSEGVVAELNFGFWTKIMSKRHMSENPSDTTDYLKPWPRLLKQTFPHVPKQRLNRNTLETPLNNIRKLRNRISHHEPIWYQSNLDETYADAKQLCHWLSPAMADVIQTIDRFPEVYAGGSMAHHDDLRGLTGWEVRGND
ncbi:MAG: Abi family protein [Coriobacteriia bacterium]|nr:Abi family protein [Coriobacteriia bacterium]